MGAIKILIVEDELIIAEAISMKLTSSGFLITAAVQSGEEALEAVDRERPDLIFMDIRLAGKLDGIETAKALLGKGDFPVIFLTDLYDDRTIRRASALNPAAYLLKPFDLRQLLASIGTALYNIKNRQAARPEAGPYSEDLLRIREHIFIREQSGTYKKYKLQNILYIQADRSYADIVTDSGKITQSMNMKSVFEKIAHPDLIQVHRSYVVNTQRIDALKGNILIVGGHEVTVSEQYRSELLKRIPILK